MAQPQYARFRVFLLGIKVLLRMCSLTEVVQGEILRQPFFPASRGILKVTQIVCTVQQTCAYTWNGPSSFVNRIRYQNIHVVNVRQIFLLGLGVCLITQES